MNSVCFVGLGNMGYPMASRLVAAGYDVTVVDVDPARAAAFVDRVGGRAADDASKAAAAVDAVITMLPSSNEVATVLRAVAGTLRPGCVVVEMSSGVPAVTRALAAELASHDVQVVDCPVSGGVGKAATGELSVMAGGAGDVLAKVEPLLAPMSSRILHCGDVGSGQAMKSLNNLVSAAGLLATVEAVLIGRGAGLDPEVMIDVLDASTGMNNSTRNKMKQFVLSRSFDSGFGIGLMAKDLRIAMQMRADLGISTPLSSTVEQLFSAAAAVLGGGADHTAIAKFSELLAGEEA